MIYTSLDKLPIVLYYRILETNNLQLLIKKSTDISELELQEIWEKLQLDFQYLDDNHLNKKVFNLTKQYNINILRHQLVSNYIELLTVEYNEEYISELKKYGFNANQDNYIEKLEIFKKDLEGFIIKANHFKAQIPKTKDEENSEKVSIEEVLASFTNVLGYSIGNFMKITCLEYLSFKKIVLAKLKSQEKELLNLKNRKN